MSSPRPSRRRWWVIAPPFFWLLLFFAAPFALVLKISLGQMTVAMPPVTDLLQWVDGRPSLNLHLGNYQLLLQDPLYLRGILSSLRIAAIATLLCLLVGYPMAYCIARLPPASRNLCLLLVILPSWTSFLIRIYAWIAILKPSGLMNSLLLKLGLIEQPLAMLYTDTAVFIGIVYAYLPFMVLPLYATLVKLDPRLLEAAGDLGARPLRRFLSITLPLSVPGIIAGCMLVFIPAMGEYVIPELLGGPGTLMIGKLIWQDFFNNRDWPVASATAVLMLALLLLPMVLFHRQQQRELEGTP